VIIRRGYIRSESACAKLNATLRRCSFHYIKNVRVPLLGGHIFRPLELRVTFTLMASNPAAVCARPPGRDLLIISPPALIETSFCTQQHTAAYTSVLSRRTYIHSPLAQFMAAYNTHPIFTSQKYLFRI